ncbi:hypothetical protein, partial [Flavobacterium sp.]|uniref:hypothetical protein n=1 Tax=Flavobacterium sp. TaxID=239 RepID=UPI0040341CFC
EGGNGKELLADRYKIHRSFSNYLDIERYILEKRDGLRNLDLLTLCNYDNGLFAKGPKKILQSYYNCLLANSKKPYFLDNTIASQSTP